MSIAWISKGILDSIHMLCYRFILVKRWEEERNGSSLLEENSHPKEYTRGLGTKKPLSFFQSLATKNVLRLIQGQGLWEQTIKDKYLGPTSIEDWI
jgi:hypothetical protein